MIQLVSAVECEISTDNSTWQKVNSTLNMGCIDETNNLISIQNLQSATEYDIRCRNGTTQWGYEHFTTKAGGLDEMELSITILFAFFGILFIVLGIILLVYYQKKRDQRREREDD